MEEAKFLDSPRHETSSCLIAHKLVFDFYLVTRIDVMGVQVGCTLLVEGLHLCSEGPHQAVYVERLIHLSHSHTHTHTCTSIWSVPLHVQVLFHFTQ